MKKAEVTEIIYYLLAGGWSFAALGLAVVLRLYFVGTLPPDMHVAFLVAAMAGAATLLIYIAAAREDKRRAANLDAAVVALERLSASLREVSNSFGEANLNKGNSNDR